jgi:membrane-associated protein
MFELQHHFQDIAPVIHFIKNGSYFGIFFLAIIASYVFPIPEAVFLILVGYVAKITGMDLVGVLMLTIAGIIIGDNILYRLSFFGNKYVEKFNRKMRKHKLLEYEHLVVDNVAWTVYFLKFVAGVRFFNPVILGSLRAPWKKFFVHNAIASILHTTLLVLMGFYLNKKIIPVLAGVEIFKNGMLFSSVVIVGFLVNIFSNKK